MKRYEYTVLTLDIKGGKATGLALLNEMGEAGWHVHTASTIGDSTGLLLLLEHELPDA